MGTQSNLLAYNILRNTDQFFVDVQDGVNSLLIGDVTTANKPRLVAGGNCSVLGFDEDGGEAFWTVTGDNVSSLALCDVDSQGSAALLVGSDDFEVIHFCLFFSSLRLKPKLYVSYIHIAKDSCVPQRGVVM